jgi:hypothetical protein
MTRGDADFGDGGDPASPVQVLRVATISRKAVLRPRPLRLISNLFIRRLADQAPKACLRRASRTGRLFTHPRASSTFSDELIWAKPPDCARNHEVRFESAAGRVASQSGASKDTT